MGFFDFLKSDNNNNSSKLDSILTELNVNPYDYNHEEMEVGEVTIDDELKNVIKVSDLNLNEGEKPFEYISLSEKANGKRSIFLSKNDADEKDVRDLINLFYSVLGEDFVYQKEFDQNDLNAYRDEENGTFRSWYLKYEIIIAFSSKTLFVLIDDK
ncbi:MAG: hypothetical protein ACI8WA_000019 [Polaribacter sp.]|jgi:hypothetical protein